MKIGIIEKPGVLNIAERDIPKVETSTDVLVKVKRLGICGSDIHIFHGRNPFAVYPRVWGHEIVGEVVETGSAASALVPGTHVVVEPIISCGVCYACRQGRGNVCEQLKVMGVHIDGGCQEYILVPAANIHEVPQSLPWDEVVLLEPFTIGAQACYRGNVRSGDLVLVMGAGTIGLTVATMAKLAGAVVIIIDMVPEKLQYAKSLGVDHTINVKEQDLFDTVREISGGMGANVTVDAVCNKKSFEDAVEITSVAGRVVELSFNELPSDIAPVGIVKKELTIYGSRLQTKRFPVVIDYLKQGKLPLEGFVSKVFPIDQMVQAFDYTDKNNASIRKVLVSFD
ncbi:MAG: zinc-binding alcohol dehydrogenase family protein [Treponema sp.]|jgi:L-gulonate 5-dehydrogenase|nr:zinc-binding alcohol dehydrogenase family protein [Treponema sp.]